MEDSGKNNSRDPFTIGITGGIGAGKSVVSRILRHRGFPVYDCDTEAKRLMRDDPEVRRQLISALGSEIYSPEGELDNRRIASIIFSDEEKRGEVNHIVHRAVRDDFKRWRISSAKRIVFVESAILASSGLADMCDEIWLVDAPDEVRIERACRRNNASRDDVRKRVEVQKMEFSSLPDNKLIIINNDGNSPLLSQIEQHIKTKNIDRNA